YSRERTLVVAMLEELRRLGIGRCGHDPPPREAGPLARVRLLGSCDSRRRVGVFSFVHESIDPHELAMVLEQGFGILCRGGLHCAPRAHDVPGGPDVPKRGGALRLSLGPFLTREDITYACASLAGAVTELAPRSTGAR